MLGGERWVLSFPSVIGIISTKWHVKCVTGTVILHRMPVGQWDRVASRAVAVCDRKLYAAMAYGKL